jgi:hypothetical protein
VADEDEIRMLGLGLAPDHERAVIEAARLMETAGVPGWDPILACLRTGIPRVPADTERPSD